MDEILFALPNREFLVTRGANGQLKWVGEYLGTSIVSALPVEQGRSCVVLLDPDASRSSTFQNLVCLRNDGGLVWRAELPEGNDAYVWFGMENDALSASSWSGFKVSIDIANGKILDKVFTK